MGLENTTKLSVVPGGPKGFDASGRERLIALTIELSKRALNSKSADELYFLMTNDIRVLIEFDRSFLVTHFGGETKFVAAGNQPILEKKSEIYGAVQKLGSDLRESNKPFIVPSPEQLKSAPDELIKPELKNSLLAFMEISRSKSMLCVPLDSGTEVVGHIILEYFQEAIPDQNKVAALLNLAPAFTSALARDWLVKMNPSLIPMTSQASWKHRPLVKLLYPYWRYIAVILAALIVLLFFVPVTFNVGGEVETIPHDRYVAFAEMDGLIHKIFVNEGQVVNKGDVLAVFDAVELNHRINAAERQAELLATEAHILKNAGPQDLSKLAEAQLIELKRKSVLVDRDFLKWQKQYLEIKAPASGNILTKHIETLVGKKFKAGEPFCEIAAPAQIQAEIQVPEDRIKFVAAGQSADVYLNGDPMRALPITIKEIAPKAETETRQGSIYRVKGDFEHPDQSLKVGMKGVGKIKTGSRSIWTIASQRIHVRLNRLMLHLW